MKKILFILMLFVISTAIADRIPPAMPENQAFTIDTTINAVGILDQGTKTDWIVAKEGPLENRILNGSEVLSLVVYRDSLMTNGGNINEVQNYEFNSGNQGRRTYNINQEKILTYLSEEGSHLVGAEYLMMDNVGNYSNSSPAIRCVFAEHSELMIPAFCNVVRARSDLININHAKISTKGEIRSVGGFSTPAGLNYQIAVTPDGKTGFAEGTVKTEFAGNIMEARDTNGSIDTWNRTAAENSWKDTTQTTGGIKNLQKKFRYLSGLRP